MREKKKSRPHPRESRDLKVRKMTTQILLETQLESEGVQQRGEWPYSVVLSREYAERLRTSQEENDEIPVKLGTKGKKLGVLR